MARKVKLGTADAPPRQATPAPHWKKLTPGSRVRVLLAPGFEAGGLVDAVTADHSAVWIDFDGGRGRTLLHCSDGVDIVLQEDALAHEG
ncbi:hypothetical protein [Arthrobacter sp. OY3WO11]|uniref:hypothetical protein n=1 Tax=Arthrobacter sp. OY3WO11 TaxID=1835723 RepID=UPI0007CF840C|nr:hypothetical protein [Arthrobacter sp. OY3WO11]OAE00350.1 hypothetical protein A6A22_02030 [Arthrobacter sp. OY3WO11]